MSSHDCILFEQSVKYPDISFVYFVLRHINLIGHLMPNRMKKNKSEKKFIGEILGIKDKL